MADPELRERARRAVIEQPVDCLTYDEIIRIERAAPPFERPAGRRDTATTVRVAARIAGERRQARIRAALATLYDELAAALSPGEVERLIDLAIGEAE